MKKTKKRDVAEQGKGFYLQKLRAAKLLLETAESSPDAIVYCSVEHGTDVQLISSNKKKSSHYREEDKNFAAESNFSFNSHEILNTLVIFIDCWIDKSLTKHLSFGFYSTNGIAKEKKTSDLKENLPDKPILEILKSKEVLSEDLIGLLASKVTAEYKQQYKTQLDESHFSTLETFTSDDWKKFFEKIDWGFGQADHKNLQQELLKIIKNHRCYEVNSHKGKEEEILRRIIEKIEQRHLNADHAERIVCEAEVRCIFLEVGAGQRPQHDDPVWELWKKLKPADTRNFEEKIKAVCLQLTGSNVDSWNRKVALSLVEQREFDEDKSILSVRYRVFDVCQEALAKKIASNMDRIKNQQIKEDELAEWINELLDCAKACLTDASQNFKYSVTNNDSFVRGIIFMLIDSCFLNFDGK